MRSPAHLEPLPRRRSLAPWVLLTLGAVLLVWLLAEHRALKLADQEVRARWSQLSTTWEERRDLVPRLVELLKANEGFEPTMLAEVATARARAVQQVGAETADMLRDGPALERIGNAELMLGGSLQRLRTAAREHSDVSTTTDFRVLEAQFDALEARLAIERLRFNEAVRAFNATRSRFPAVVVAGLRPSRFGEKPFLEALNGTEKTPQPPAP